MGPVEWALLLLLALLWGGSFFFSKIAVGELPPLTVVLCRVALAALALNVVVVLSGRRMPANPRPGEHCSRPGRRKRSRAGTGTEKGGRCAVEVSRLTQEHRARILLAVNQGRRVLRRSSRHWRVACNGNGSGAPLQD
jgi:drug/metabolite transporter (DMT)-like permease